MNFLHKIAHKLGFYNGVIYSELRGSQVWLGFQCGECGKVEDLHCVDDVIDRELKLPPNKGRKEI